MSEHFQDFAPVVTKAAPASYPGEMRGRGRWFRYGDAGLLWTNDGDGLGLLPDALTDWDLANEVLAAIAKSYTDGVTPTELFNVWLDQVNPGVWSEGPLSVLLD